MAVKPHPLAPVLLMAINWAQPQDPEKKYPELGRMRYAWMSEDYSQIKILLKDGPGSWTEQEYRDAIMNQIKTHETFVSVEVQERDNVYIVATFTPIKKCSYLRAMISDDDDFGEMMSEIDKECIENGLPSVTAGPWELFDKAMVDLENGVFTPEIKNLQDTMSEIIGDVDAQDKLSDIAKESGVDFKKDHVYEIKPDGKLKK
jgi:hypothetical protein